MGLLVTEEPRIEAVQNRLYAPYITTGREKVITPFSPGWLEQVGEFPIIDKKDGWSVTSSDCLRTSHYEHQVAVVDGKAEILTALN